MAANETPAPTTVAPEITVDVLQLAASKLGVRVPPNVEDDFAEQMRSAREAILEVVAMEGTLPPSYLTNCSYRHMFFRLHTSS